MKKGKMISPCMSDPPQRPQAEAAAVEAVGGLIVAALSHLVAALVSRKYAADPTRILPALRPTTEEIIFVTPIVGVALSGLPRRWQAGIALAVLGLWFGSRILLAVQAGEVARAESIPPEARRDDGDSQQKIQSEVDSGKTKETARKK